MKFEVFLRVSGVALSLAAMTLSAHAESLTQALTSAYNNNPQIASALLSVKEDAESVAQRKAGKLPVIGMGISASDAYSVAGGQPLAEQRSGQIGLTYRQTLFDNYQTDAQIDQARALVEVSKQALRNAEQNVLLAVAQAYMNVVRDTQLVQLRSENVNFLEAQVNSAQERLNIGEGTRIDLSQAQTSLAQGVAGYRAAIASLQTSQATYERYVGHKPQGLVGEYRFGKLLPTSIDSAINSSETNHPAVLSARAAIRAAQANSDAAAAAFGPTLDLVGQVAASSAFPGLVTPPTDFNPTLNSSLQLTLSIPLYSGGALGATVRQANLGQMRSEVDAMATRDQVREAVITSWATLQNATAQITSAQQTLTSANEVLQATIQSRDVGQSTTLDVLEAQATVTSARESLITATSSKIIASFSLIAATGRLSPQDLGLNVALKYTEAEKYAARVEDVWQELRAIDE